MKSNTLTNRLLITNLEGSRQSEKPSVPSPLVGEGAGGEGNSFLPGNPRPRLLPRAGVEEVMPGAIAR